MAMFQNDHIDMVRMKEQRPVKFWRNDHNSCLPSHLLYIYLQMKKIPTYLSKRNLSPCFSTSRASSWADMRMSPLMTSFGTFDICATQQRLNLDERSLYYFYAQKGLFRSHFLNKCSSNMLFYEIVYIVHHQLSFEAKCLQLSKKIMKLYQYMYIWQIKIQIRRKK